MTKPDFSIRRYDAAHDWADLCRIHDAARRQELEASVGIRAFRPLEAVAESEGLFDNELHVGCVAGQMVGFVAFSQNELAWLYVDPAVQRYGFGRQLVRFAIMASNQPMTTEVLVGNSGALALYLSEGFRETEVRSGHLQGDETIPASAHILVRTPDRSGGA